MISAEVDSAPHKVVVVGAGVCGLYAALTLLRGGAEVTVLEKEDYVGGLAAGMKFGDNYADFGVHMLHSFNRCIFEDCAALMGSERIEAELDARIRWGESTCRYPLKALDMLKAMPIVTLVRCVSGLLIAELSGAKHKANLDNAEEALIAFYGVPLYEFFFEEFTQRYWGIHPRELSAEFIRRKMPRLSVVDVMRKLLPKRRRKTVGLVENALDQETLHYSASGAETLPRCLAKSIEKLGGVIVTSASVLSLHKSGVKYQKDGREVELNTTAIVNTAPLASFLKAVKDAPLKVIEASQQLKYKPIVVYALLVNREKCMDGLYTYYRNRVFHRVGEPKNAGLRVSPKSASVLIVESTCDLGDERWEDSQEFRQQVLSDLEAEGVCCAKDVMEWKPMSNAYGYPVYSLHFEQYLDVIQAWLDTQSHLISTGRQGGFTYPAMHSAMQMGKDAAISILDE